MDEKQILVFAWLNNLIQSLHNPLEAFQESVQIGNGFFRKGRELEKCLNLSIPQMLAVVVPFQQQIPRNLVVGLCDFQRVDKCLWFALETAFQVVEFFHLR